MDKVPTEMRAAVYHKFGDIEQTLSFETLPVPLIHDHEVLIRVHACGINPVDWKRANGMLEMVMKKLPYIPCEDVSGVVAKCGIKCSRIKVGDEVMAKLSPMDGGGMAEYCAVSEDMVAQKPSQLSFAEAASLPLAGLTALQALKKREDSFE
jgi:NADPH:quinone reductase-like Zn-dependent oxidoreductase